MKKIVFPLTLLLLSFSFPQKKKITIWLCGDSTISIKESKVHPETGWGMPFVHFWDSTIKVENRARNGRSTKTFISEKLWQHVIENVKDGDYVFIQFGHNDEAKDKGERYATPDTFKMNLTRFIREAREKKATPILFTPVSRRKFDKEGNAIETHKEYSALTKEVAGEQNVLFIDLDEKSRALYQQFGEQHSKLLFLQLQPGEHPNYPEGRNDNTHFSELGARLIAQLVLKELRGLNIELTDRVFIPPVKK